MSSYQYLHGLKSTLRVDARMDDSYDNVKVGEAAERASRFEPLPERTSKAAGMRYQEIEGQG